jgi:hypothetical protein
MGTPTQLKGLAMAREKMDAILGRLTRITQHLEENPSAQFAQRIDQVFYLATATLEETHPEGWSELEVQRERFRAAMLVTATALIRAAGITAQWAEVIQILNVLQILSAANTTVQDWNESREMLMEIGSRVVDVYNVRLRDERLNRGIADDD